MNLIITLVGVALSLALAIADGDRWKARFPSKLGFKWGYFYIFSSGLGNSIWLIIGIYASLANQEVAAALILISLLAIFAVTSFYARERQVWALILTTVFTLNPLWWLINVFYFKNRWREFKEEKSPIFDMPQGKYIVNLERDVKSAIFFSCAWLVCVPSFVMLFRPYGRYMYGDQYAHMFAVMVFPVIIGVVLFFVYRRFVK